jgi:hypothetical protein
MVLFIVLPCKDDPTAAVIINLFSCMLGVEEAL